jgi:Recombinase
VPGPTVEVETVRRVFRSFVFERKGETRITAELNADNIRTLLGNRWEGETLRKLITNERYLGHLIYNRTSAKLKGRRVLNPPDIKPNVKRARSRLGTLVWIERYPGDAAMGTTYGATGLGQVAASTRRSPAYLRDMGLREVVWVDFMQIQPRKGAKRWQHAGKDFESKVLFVAEPIGSSLDNSDLVVEPLDEAQRDFVLLLAVGCNAIPNDDRSSRRTSRRVSASAI